MGSTPIDITLTQSLQLRLREHLSKRTRSSAVSLLKNKKRVIQIGLPITEEQVSRMLMHREMFLVKIGGGQPSQ